MIDPLNERIRRLVLELTDELCSWERSTGEETVLILRSNRGYCHRAVDGKPNVPDDVSDTDLMRNILGA